MADNALYRKKAGAPAGEVEQINITVDPGTGDMTTGGKVNSRNIATDGTNLDNHIANNALHDTMKVSANDSASGYLEDKVVKGPGIVRTVENEGGNETLKFELGPHYKAIASSGLYTGAVLSVGGTVGTFSITAGEGLYIDSTTDFSNIQVNPVTIAAQTDIAVTNIATQPVTYILVDNAGNIVQNTTFPTATERRNNIFIGVVVHSDNVNVLVVNNIPSVALDVTGQLQDLFNALGFFNQSGNVISPNGTNLNINKSAGTAFKAGANFQNNAKDPHTLTLASQTAATFRYRNQDSSEAGDTTVIDPTSYDVGGTTTPIAGNNNQATLQRIYVFPSNIIRVQYGQEVFSNLSDAASAAGKESFITESNIQENGLLLATLAVTKGCTDLSDESQALFFNASRFGELGSVGSSAIGTLQDTYNNSIPNPEILTTDTNGALTLRRGTTGGDSDVVLEVQNNAGTSTFSVDGEGNVTSTLTSDTPTAGSYTIVDADANRLKRIDGPLTIPTGLTVGKQFGVFQISSSPQLITTTGLAVEGNPRANMTPGGVITFVVTATDTVLIKGETEA